MLRAQDDGAGELDDPVLLDRASALGRLLVTEDDDLLNEAARRQRSGEPFAGVVFASRRRVTVSQAIDDLELLAQAGDPAEFSGTVIYLPLR